MKRLVLLLTVFLLWGGSAQAALSAIASTACSQITGNASTSITCNVPAGTLNNDFLLFTSSYQNGTPAVPTSSTGLVFITYDSPANGFVGVLAMGKCASAEGATEVVTTGTGVMWGQGQLTAYRGSICPNSPVDKSTGGSSHGFTTAPAIPALGGTTANANEWAIQIVAIAPGVAATYTQPGSATVDGAIVNSGTGQQAGLGVSHIVYASAGSTVTSQTGTLSTTNSWAGLQLTLIPQSCPTLTSACDCPNGAGVSGVCECGATTVSNLLNCFIVPSNTNETASVIDALTACSPGTVPVGGGGNFCTTGWNGSAWLEN